MKDLPGQRQGSREWYWFRQFLSDELGFEWCDVQPCLAKTEDAVVLLHVDDVLFCGNRNYFHNVFLKKCQGNFSASYNLLGKVGSSISFLKKKMVRVQDGILLVLGTKTEKIVEAFEAAFGSTRVQVVPCDGSIQLEDGSKYLISPDASKFRSIVGMCLFLGRDRPDVIFSIKELASKMSYPTVICANWWVTSKVLASWELNCNALFQAKANGKHPLTNVGCWKHFVTPIGCQTENTEDLQAADYLS